MIEENFIKLFEDSFRKFWDLPAFSDYGTPKTLTYGQLAEQVARLHILFQECGIKKNDKIALIGRNTCNWVAAYMATVTYGAIIVPILQDFKPNDVIHIINHSDSRLLFTHDIMWENLDMEQLPELVAVFSLTDYRTLAVNEPLDINHFNEEKLAKAFKKKYGKHFQKEHVKYIDKPNSEVVCISYTSGTTGFSKGVMLTGNNLAGNVTFGMTTGIVYPGSKQVTFLPLAHAFGCAFEFLSNICLGGHSYLISRTPSPKILLQAFAEIKPNCIFSVPLIIEKIYKKQIVPMISKAPLSWVLNIPLLDEIVLTQIRQKLMAAFGGEFKQIIIGGAPLNAEVEAFFHRIKFPFAVGYGMTECGPLISFSNHDKYIPFTCGYVLPKMEVKIDSPNSEGIGEILVRGENVMCGYYKNEEATKLAFTEDGWLKSGDLGILENGVLTIKGRNKTMLLGPSGQNIYPEEIEAKLNNMPFVLESLVMQQDDKLYALVCPDYAEFDASNLSRADLLTTMEENRKQLNAQLAAYEQVAKIRIYPHEFEKTPKKSIKRFLYNANMGE